MLKRIFAFGAALAVAFSLSLSVFAFTSDSISLEFPFYGHTRVRQGTTQVYLSSDGSQPITSDSSLSLSGSGGSLIFDFFPMSSSVSLSEIDVQTITHPYYRLDAYQHWLRIDFDQSRYENPLYDSDWTYISDHAFDDDLDFSQYSTLTCNTISSGDYVIEGTFVFDNNAIGNLDSWNNMISGITATVADTSSNTYPISMTSPVYQVYKRNNQDFVNFRLCLTIPYSGEYQRIFFQINSKNTNGIPSLKGFFVNTGSVQFQTASNTQSLSVLLGSWFDKLIGTIKANSVSDDDKAAQAEESADREAVSEAQSQVSEIKSFESSLNSSITQSVSNIDFTVPSSFGAALGAVSFIFGSLFTDLGGYQVVITIPLILGIMLILIGRGTLALGRVISANARAQRDFERTADRPVKGHKDWS